MHVYLYIYMYIHSYFGKVTQSCTTRTRTHVYHILIFVKNIKNRI